MWFYLQLFIYSSKLKIIRKELDRLPYARFLILFVAEVLADSSDDTSGGNTAKDKRQGSTGHLW
jgi:hypothetical protein